MTKRARDSTPSDPFGTAELRRRVLDAWRESPARFRADANIEDDLALVGYRDRVVVELAQNASDAAVRAGRAGSLRLTLDGSRLLAANTGAALDAGGLESIAVARASAKRGDPALVGRFGVGFAAVLSVSDEPAIRSTSGAVRWSRAESFSAVSRIPELTAELAASGGHTAVLRLPLPATGEPPAGYDTEIELPLRDDAAVDAVGAQLADLDQTLLLSLPGLTEIVVSTSDAERRLRRDDKEGDVVVLYDDDRASRWLVAQESGPLDPALLADQPVEARDRDQWSVRCALPVDAAGALSHLPDDVARVVRAPTATDDLLSLPVVVIASYPLDAARRRVTPGPLTDAVSREVARVLVDRIATMPASPPMIALVPSGLPGGEVDAAVQDAVRIELEATAWLPAASDVTERLRPRDAVIVPDALVASLASELPGVLPAGWSDALLGSLGVRRPSVRDLVEAVATIEAPPSWWRELYAGFAEAVPPGPERDALAALVVPLVGGELMTGPRGVVVAEPDAGLGDLSVLGVRVAHPDAAHPLLHALGAGQGGARDILELPQVREAVEASLDVDDPEAVASAVLNLVGAAGTDSDALSWLTELAVPSDVGDWRPAGDLLLPGGAMASLVAEDSGFSLVADEAVERWGADALRAVGVLDRPAVVRDVDATGPDHDLDDEERWWDTLPTGAAIAEFAAVRDLEQLRDGVLDEVLALLTEPPLRDVLLSPAVVLLPDGGAERVPSYTAWWLSSRPVLAGSVPNELRLASSDPALAALYDLAPGGFDDELLLALGVHDSLADADPEDVLERLADERRVVTRESLRILNAWLAGADMRLTPSRVRAVQNGGLVVVDAADALILDAPDLAPLAGGRAIVPVAADLAPALAEQLGVALTSTLASFAVVSHGEVEGDATIHEQLTVLDADGTERRVPWRIVDGVLHVDARQRAYGLGRGRAWRDGEWAMRHRRTEEAASIDLAALDAEDDLDDG